MMGGKIVILVFLAPDESKSSQRIGMLDARHEKPWEQGPGRRERSQGTTLTSCVVKQRNSIRDLDTGRKCGKRRRKI